MKKITLIITLLILIINCKHNKEKATIETKAITPYISTAFQDSITEVYLNNTAWKEPNFSQEYQEAIDKGLAIDSTIPYLWQQKAMPLFKQGKYDIGLAYINKAVKYNRREWQEYRAFMTCIFAKRYKDAIEDFTDCKKRFGNNYVMDHTYNFYIALSKIQLNEFKEAEDILLKEIQHQKDINKGDLIHHLDYFYLGIAKFEQKKYYDAIEIFDKALLIYPEFSEVIYYKGFCLFQLDKKDEGNELILKAIEFRKDGYTINEDNALHEWYPYQLRMPN